MSYSFSFRAADKAAAKAQVDLELTKVVDQQPVHAADREHAQATANAFIDSLGSDEGRKDGEGKDLPAREIAVNVHGSCWARDGQLQQASVGVSVSYCDPTPA